MQKMGILRATCALVYSSVFGRGGSFEMIKAGKNTNTAPDKYANMEPNLQKTREA